MDEAAQRRMDSVNRQTRTRMSGSLHERGSADEGGRNQEKREDGIDSRGGIRGERMKGTSGERRLERYTGD
jgi:hypothetical protein